MPQSARAATPDPAAVPLPDQERISVEIEALAAPDTLSRLLEPLVVMQALPARVSAAVDADGATMTVCLDLGRDRTSAERLVRRLSGAVTVHSARIVGGQALAVVSGS